MDTPKARKVVPLTVCSEHINAKDPNCAVCAKEWAEQAQCGFVFNNTRCGLSRGHSGGHVGEQAVPKVGRSKAAKAAREITFHVDGADGVGHPAINVKYRGPFPDGGTDAERDTIRFLICSAVSGIRPIPWRTILKTKTCWPGLGLRKQLESSQSETDTIARLTVSAILPGGLRAK